MLEEYASKDHTLDLKITSEDSGSGCDLDSKEVNS